MLLHFRAEDSTSKVINAATTISTQQLQQQQERELYLFYTTQKLKILLVREAKKIPHKMVEDFTNFFLILPLLFPQIIAHLQVAVWRAARALFVPSPSDSTSSATNAGVSQVLQAKLSSPWVETRRHIQKLPVLETYWEPF